MMNPLPNNYSRKLAVALLASVLHDSTAAFQPHTSSIPTNGVSLGRAVADTTRTTYDLGIGKNAPVVSTPLFVSQPMEETTRFLVEHEAVRPYPPPLQQQQKKQNKVFPKLIPQRVTKDSDLFIDANLQAVGRLKDYELNTVWLELLIEQSRQQQQVAPTVPVSVN